MQIDRERLKPAVYSILTMGPGTPHAALTMVSDLGVKTLVDSFWFNFLFPEAMTSHPGILM